MIGTVQGLRLVVDNVNGNGKFLLALTVVFAGCSAGSGAESTSTNAAVTSSTTSSVATTTSSTMTPTSTTASTVLTTTTTTLLEGNWAEMPVVTSSAGWTPLGWWDGSKWVDFQGETDLPVEGGEDYQTALIGTESQITTGSPTQACTPVNTDFPGIRLADSGLLERIVENDPSGSGAVFGVAISAPWNLTPRSITEGEADPDLQQTAVELLGEADFDTDSVTVVQTVDADLDGDGTVETFAVAEETTLFDETISDVYSMLFAVGPSLGEPVVLARGVIPPDETGRPERFRVGAIADLNGDGTMEVIVDQSTPRSTVHEVHEMIDGRFVVQISGGCGV